LLVITEETGNRKQEIEREAPALFVMRPELVSSSKSAAAIPGLVVPGFQPAFREFIARHGLLAGVALLYVRDITIVVRRADDGPHDLRHSLDLVSETEVRRVE
jgi:hypothetical protein